MTPTDPLYASQWHFALMGNIERIWGEYSGAGVHVGVYDDGIAYNHADLDGNYDATRHVLDNLGNPVDPYPDVAGSPGDAHGTSCAGIIGAEANNGAGGTGVASGASLTGVNIFGAGTYGFVNGALAPFLAVVRQATNFDISSNSWGATPVYTEGLSGGGFADQLENEYAYLSANGRAGRGTIIAQAAGNDSLDANGDGVNSTRYSITVAATDQFGFAQDYTNFGACILVAAPAAAVTTDIPGVNGYDPTDYTNSFGGTSAATPVVSGVIALMLQSNPNLGWRDVQNILANSASQTGSALGGAASGFEVGAWMINRGDNWNGGGLHVHTDYGYGMINAYNAVRMAEIWGQFGAPQISANEQSTASAVVNLGGMAIPDDNPAGVSFNITVGTSLQIEHVQLVMNFSHTFVGDLKITLTSAEGATIVIALNSGIETSFNGEWVYGIDSLRGELSAGTWTVNVADMAGLDVGALNSAYLNVFGTAPSANDVFHITDEFLEMKALEASRGTIIDADGGTDWLNFAAIAGNIILNLASGSSFSVNGVTWGALGAATLIENAIGGDGADSITGSSADNKLFGMRGADFLYGGGGNDSLVGGAGIDQLFGGAGFDTADFSSVTGGAGIYADLVNGFAQDNGGAFDAINAIEAVFGTNALRAGALSDVMLGDTNSNSFYGFGGQDYILGAGGDDYIDVGSGMTNIALGGAGNDTVVGGADDDFMYGNAGNDTLTGAGGNDWLFAGDFSGPAITGSDTCYGGAGNDVIAVGSQGGNFLLADGGAGNDIIYGGALANDVIRGGSGSDYMYGNTGADTYRFEAGDLISGDQDSIFMNFTGDHLSFALSYQNQISIAAGTNAGVSGVYLAHTGSTWIAWLPYQTVATVNAELVFV
jgi:subtilisin-like proprotein convertase family protein